MPERFAFYPDAADMWMLITPNREQLPAPYYGVGVFARLRQGITLERAQEEQADKVKRFQNEAARPFKRINGAAAILDDNVFAETDLTVADATGHPNIEQLRLIVIRGPSLMKLVHALQSVPSFTRTQFWSASVPNW